MTILGRRLSIVRVGSNALVVGRPLLKADFREHPIYQSSFVGFG